MRTVVGRVAALAVGLVACLLWGVTTASAEAGLGPHLARYEVTLDDVVTVDLGPLGTLVVDSPLPATLGARVVVKEIPRDVTTLEAGVTFEALSRDLERYVQFFGAPESTLEVATRALVTDAVRRAALAAALLAAVVLTVRALLGPARRDELATQVARHRPVVAGSTALAVVGSIAFVGSAEGALEEPTAMPASAVFDGTPLEGARLTGRLAGVIDTYGGYVVDAWRENERFYGEATASLEAAWADRAETDAAVARARAQLRLQGVGPAVTGPTGTPAPTGDPADGAAGPGAGTADDADDAAADDAGADPAAADPEVRTLLVVSDLHCNVGMAPVIRRAAQLSGADVVLNAGDTTVNGTAVESYCVDALVGAAPRDVETVVADGNHDSATTSGQERAAGARVLDGEVVEVEGLRVLGDADPRATRIGEGTSLAGEETVAEVGERLAEVACATDEPVDLLLVHDPATGEQALERGCVRAQVSGHMHRREGPVRVGEGVRYTSGSSAGASLGMPTVGPLRGTAELTVLRFDLVDRRFLDHRVVLVQPDGSVDVGFALPWTDPTGRPGPPPGIE